MQRIILLILSASLSIVGCSEDKKRHQLGSDYPKIHSELENLSIEEIRKHCEFEIKKLRALYTSLGLEDLTNEHPEVVGTPEHTEYMNCHGRVDKNFLAGIIKSDNTEISDLRKSVAIAMLNTAIRNDMKDMCVKENSEYDPICHINENKRVYQSLGIDF